MASQHRSLRLLLVSLFLVASVTTSQSRFSPDGSPSPSPSPSQSPSPSPSLSPDLSPSESPLSSEGFSSFGDAPARFDELPTTSVISSTSIDMGLSSSLSAIHIGANPLVSRICDNTDHPTLCIATVVPFLNGDQASLDSVLKVSVQAGSEYAKEALAVVERLAKSRDTSPDIKATLKDCKNSYDTAVENFAKTMDAFAMSDVGTMRSVLSATITFVGDCEDGFVQMQTKSPVSRYAERLTDMTSNCLAIVAQMMN